MSVGFSRIAIVGHGLIGGSIALAVRANAPHATVLTMDRGDDLRAVRDADLVILSAPILTNIDLLHVLPRHVSADAVITDVGSTKVAITQAAAAVRFVGGHPMAGAAVGGREHARADLFTGRPWILTRGESSTDEDAVRVESFVAALGAAPRWMDVDVHDTLFAVLSHLPQLAISALMDVVGREVSASELGLAGTGLRDTTRLASSPPEIWCDVVATNAIPVRRALDALIATLVRLRDDDDGHGLRDVFERAAVTRAHLEKL